MKKFLIVSLMLLPSLFFAQESERSGRAVAFVCKSKGAGPASPISISFSAAANFGTEIYQGVISSLGVQLHTFAVYLEGEVKNSQQFSLNFTNEGAAPEQAIKGSLTLELKEANLDGEMVSIPAGTGLVELSIKPEIGTTVFTQYALSDCMGIIN